FFSQALLAPPRLLFSDLGLSGGWCSSPAPEETLLLIVALFSSFRGLAFWWGHGVLLSALFQRVGSGGASGARSEIGDLLTVRFEWCLGSSSRDEEFSFSHLQFVSTLLSSSIWLPWCSPTVLILSGLWVW
ncbi:unnamed protein product, partial [Brassica rapa subsp. narinosa]